MTLPRRAIVTGASGFLGGAALEALAARGVEPIAFVRSPQSADALSERMQRRIETVVVDLLDPNAVASALSARPAEALAHFAWATDPRKRWTDEANLDWLAATLTLARAFAHAGGKRFVGCGSCAEYDWDGGVLSEDTTPLRPRSLYGAAKAAAYLSLNAAAPQLGLSFAWGRVFFCFGAHEPKGRLMSDLIDNQLAGRATPCTNGVQARDYLSAEDIGALFADLICTRHTGAFNIGRGEATPIKDMIDFVAHRTNGAHLPALGAIERAPDDPPIIVADMRRTHALLQSPPPQPLFAALSAMIDARRRYQ